MLGAFLFFWTNASFIVFGSFELIGSRIHNRQHSRRNANNYTTNAVHATQNDQQNKQQQKTKNMNNKVPLKQMGVNAGTREG